MSKIDYPNGSNDGSPIVLTDNSTQLQVLTGAATQSGAISQSSGTFGLEKIGTGILIVTADNTYTGGTTISGGTLQLGTPSTAGSLLGNVLNNAKLEFDRSDTVTFAGDITGSGIVWLAGQGTVIFTGTNSYTGDTTVFINSNLQAGNGGTSGSLANGAIHVGGGVVTFDRSNSYTFSGSITDAVDGTGLLGRIAVIGSGTTIFTGANTYTGGTTINSGSTLQIGDGGTSGSLPDLTASPFWVDNSGTLIFNRSDTSTFHNIVNGNGVIIKQGAGTLIVNGNLNASNITISQGALQLGAGPEDGFFNASVIDNAALTIGYNANFISHVGNVISGSGTVSLTGGGGLIYDVAQTYTGGTTLSAGLLQLGTSGSLASTGALVVNGGTFDLNNNRQTVGALSGTGGTITLGLGNLTANSASNTSLATAISGTGSLTKSGTGTLVLTGANTYTGGTTVSNGTLQIGNGGGTTGSLGAGSVADNAALVFDRSDTVTVGNAISGSGTLTQAGSGTLILTADNSFTGITTILAGTLQLGNGTTTGTIAGNIVDNAELVFLHSDPFTIGNAISGTGHVTFANLDGATLIGNCTYTGGTTIDGVLVVGNGGTTGWITGDVVADGGINFRRSDDVTFSGNISGSGYLNQAGPGTLTLTGNNTNSAYTSIESGTLAIASASNIGSGDLKIYLGTLQFNGSFALAQNISAGANPSFNTNGNNDILTGVISTMQGGNLQGGFGGFNKLGTGTLTLAGADTYLGPTSIQAGTLKIGNGGTTGSLGAGSVTDNAALVFDRSDNITVANAISGTGTLTQASSSILTLTGTDTYTGQTSINAGTLALSGSGSIMPSSSVINNAVLDISQAGPGASLKSLAGSGTVALGRNTLTIYSGTGLLSTSAFSGVIADGGIAGGTGGSLEFGSGGIEALTGNNTYTGTTTIDSGSYLYVGVNTATGSLGSGAVINNGFLRYERTAAVTLNNQISGTGELDQLGSGALTLTAVESYGGRTVVGTGNTLALSGSGSVAASAYVGNAGGTFDISGTTAGASIKTLSDLQISGGVVALGSKTLTISAGVGNLFSGTIQDGGIAGGTGGGLTIASGYQFLTGNNSYTGTTTIANGARLVIGNNTATGSLGSGAVVNNGLLYYELTGAATVGNAMSGSGGLLLFGGAITLTGIDSYTGATSVNTGTLTADGAIASSSVTVANGATLAGTGTVGTTVIQAGGILAPGDAIGTLQVNGGLTLAPGANFAEQISPGAADEVMVSGSAGIGGTLTENFAGGSYGHQTFTILHAAGGLSGTFANIAVTGLPAGLDAFVTYDAQNVYLTTDHAPVVTTSNLTELHDQTLSASSLFNLSDADSDSATRYQLWDATTDPNSGYFVVGGVAQAARTVIDISAAQLAQVSFVTGTVGDSLQIRAYDGTDWSADANAKWSPFTISIFANSPPVVTTSNINALRGQSLAASSLFTVSDADGDPITRYQLWDGSTDPASGYFTVGGVVQAARTVIDISAAQLAQVSFVAGTAAPDTLQIRAYDGFSWSAADNAQWSPFTVSVPINHAPVVTTSDVPAQRNQTLAASSLFSVSDADNDPITRYQLWDATTDPASGYFTVGGVVQAARTVIDISAAQLAQVGFVTGRTGDALQIRAFDGTDWSAGDNARWSPFNVIVPPNNPPVVTTSDVAAQHDRTLALSGLFTVSDADNDAITKYQVWDATTTPDSGHFMVGGVAQAPRTVIDISAAQLAQTSFVTGGVGASLQIRAFDGSDWSAADNARWSPFNVTVPPNNPPVVTTADITTTAGQSLMASSLFTASDADGDTITEYQFWDSTTDPASGRFFVGNVAQAARTVIDLPASQLGQVSFLTGSVGDTLQVRAFDGRSWSAADNAQWSPFHIAVS